MKQLAHSLAIRLSVWFLLLSFLPMGVMAIFVRQNITDTLDEFSILEQRDTARQIALLLSQMVDSQAAQQIAQAMGNGQNGQEEILVLDQNGIILAHTYPGRVGASFARDFPPGIVANIRAGENEAFLEPGTGRLVGYAAVPGQTSSVVVISAEPPSAAWTAKIERSAFFQLAVSLLIVAISGGLVIWLFAGRPLRQLTSVSQQVSQGNLDVTVHAEDMVDDLEVLANTFNQMIAQLRDLFAVKEQRLAELRQTQVALQESEQLYRSLINVLPEGIALSDLSGTITFASPQMARMYGCETEKEALGTSAFQWIAPESQEKALRNIHNLAQNIISAENDYVLRKKDGQRFYGEIDGALLTGEDGKPKGLVTVHRDVSERMRAEQARRDSERRYRQLVETSLQGLVIAAGSPPAFVFANYSLSEMLGYSVDEILTMNPDQISGLIHPEDRLDFMGRYQRLLAGGTSTPNHRFRVLRKDGDVRWMQVLASRIEHEGKPAVQATFIDITERRRAEEVQSSLHRISEAALTMPRLEDLFASIHQAIGEIMPANNFYIALVNPLTGNMKFPYFVDAFDNPPVDLPPGGLTGYLIRSGRTLLATPEVYQQLEESGEVTNIGTPSLDWLGVPLKDRQGKTFGVMVVQSYSETTRYSQADAELLELISAQVAMVTERKQAQAALEESESKFRGVVEQSIEGIVLMDEQGRIIEWNQGQEKITGLSYNEVVGQNIWSIQSKISPENQRLPDHTGRLRGEYLYVFQEHEAPWLNQTAVREIQHRDGTIRTIETVTYPINTGTHFMMGSVTRDITERQQMETALRESEANLTAVIENSDDRIWSIDREYRLVVANSAFVQNMSAQIGRSLRLGESVLFEENALVEDPMGQGKTWQQFYNRALWGEKFSIEREMRLPGKTAWLDFHFNPIRSASGHVTGVAVIERDITLARLAAIELARAYDTTLEGWSRALDLRDRETEGHARRVTELTVSLAREFGILEPELTHIRRGALLHDIGKMGVPDQILRKPDKLNEEEWKIMSKHPELALGMLAPIAFLRPALDIPYCHHEKWDGTGYPRGLKGEEIPLSARIFAIVDVWDALISDRPYSAAWSGSDALQHICSQSGKHFDPQVVVEFDRFLRSSKFLKL